MTFEWEVWSTPLMVLGVGVIVGVAVLRNPPGDRSRMTADGRQRDLEREHETSIEALRALETERDKMAPQDYEAARKALIARGAAALRALEGRTMASEGPSTPESRPSAPPGDLGALVEVLRAERARFGDVSFDAALRVATGHGAPVGDTDAVSPTWRGALYASAVWALVALLFVFAGDQSSPRQEGGSMTGGTVAQGGPMAPMPPPQQAPDFEAMAAPLMARLDTNPNDLAALNELTQLWLSAGDAQQAMQFNQRASELAPNDPDVGASKAVLAAMVGLVPRALEILEETLAKHPDHPRSLTYKGLLLMEDGRHAEAVPVLERAVALQPGAPALQQALDAARRGEAPGAPGPAPAPAPAPGGGEVVLSGTIALAPGAKTDGAQLLFVSVRSPEGGPPLAAKRYPASAFPLQFEITTADAIAMGGPARPFPASMSVSARLDGDGNAMTREELASAGAGGVARGTTGLALTLK